MDMPYFEKLNGKNFALWKLAMSQYFKIFSLEKYVDGGATRPVKLEDLET